MSTYERILDEAEQLFATRGYRRTRVAEVAEAVGVTEPALYRYFRGKDALFEQVLLRAAQGREGYVTPAELPVPNPAPGAVQGFLVELFTASRRIPALERALEARAPGTRKGALRELEEVLGELFDLAARYAVGARIMDASALESPELARTWELEMRLPLGTSLARYLVRRAEARALALPGTAEDVAGVIGNLVGCYAVYVDRLGPLRELPLSRRRRIVVDAVSAMLTP